MIPRPESQETTMTQETLLESQNFPERIAVRDCMINWGELMGRKQLILQEKLIYGYRVISL